MGLLALPTATAYFNQPKHRCRLRTSDDIQNHLEPKPNTLQLLNQCDVQVLLSARCRPLVCSTSSRTRQRKTGFRASSCAASPESLESRVLVKGWDREMESERRWGFENSRLLRGSGLANVCTPFKSQANIRDVPPTTGTTAAAATTTNTTTTTTTSAVPACADTATNTTDDNDYK